ncbi:MAG: 6-pyruvoyl tetrahydropterin synthase family protein [Planctomyces sp.]|nr:6-pyruvoyl tetrahydropterin synthase family protein [Planctomyces sp.]
MTTSVGQYSVRVLKDSLVFSAAHFITFNGNICERLHGHNWRVEAEVSGPLDENQYVFDFIALRDGLQLIVAQLDHSVLLPEFHPQIRVSTSSDGREVTAVFSDRRWVFPSEDCRILPIANTTAELIAQWIALRFLERITDQQRRSIHQLRVSVEENFGQWADFRLCPSPVATQEHS